MSHIVTIKTEVRDANAINLACQRLQLPPPVMGEHQLFSAAVRGWGVELRDWRYPVVCNTESGQLQYDNFNGRWGNPDRLNEFLQAYACEKTKIEARRQGHGVVERELEDGSVKLTIQVNGSAS